MDGTVSQWSFGLEAVHESDRSFLLNWLTNSSMELFFLLISLGQLSGPTFPLFGSMSNWVYSLDRYA